MQEELVGIAREAAIAILDVYSNDKIFVEHKSDSSPVTEADLRSEAIIRSGLERHFSHPVVAEESPVEYARRKDWRTLWLVDPLDGTKNFLSRDDQFTINIGLVQDGVPIVGLIMQPVTGVIYYAEQGRGAFRILGDTTTLIENNRSGDELIAVSSRFHHSEKAAQFCSKYNVVEIRSYGSALKHCMMAEGKVDVYPRYVGTMEWDTAAAHCILNESRCKLLHLETGEPLRYNKKSLRNPGFVACRADLDFFSSRES